MTNEEAYEWTRGVSGGGVLPPYIVLLMNLVLLLWFKTFLLFIFDGDIHAENFVYDLVVLLVLVSKFK